MSSRRPLALFVLTTTALVILARPAEAQLRAHLDGHVVITFSNLPSGVSVGHTGNGVTLVAYAKNPTSEDKQYTTIPANTNSYPSKLASASTDDGKVTAYKSGVLTRDGNTWTSDVSGDGFMSLASPLPAGASAFGTKPLVHTFTLQGLGTTTDTGPIKVSVSGYLYALVVAASVPPPATWFCSAKVSVSISEPGTEVTTAEVSIKNPETSPAKNDEASFNYDVSLLKPTTGKVTFSVTVICNANLFTDDDLAVELVSMSAIATGHGVLVAWETAAETNTVGFRLHRAPSRSGPFKLVDPALIPAAGSPTQGASYAFLDVDLSLPLAPPWYQLEDIDLNGNSTLHEPVLVANWPTAWWWRMHQFGQQVRGR